MVFSVIETLGKMWKNIAPYAYGISLTGIVSCVFYCLFKFGFTKALNKVDTTKMKQEAVDAAKKEVKETTFKVNIQPIVLSEVKKVCEEIKNDANEKLIKSNADINERLTKLENVVVALGNYFDDSIGVSESKKTAYHEAVDNLTKTDEIKHTIVIEQLEVKEVATTKKNTETATIER